MNALRMTPSVRSTLADPALRNALVAMVRRRVPPPEVDEIVQATLTEALASKSCPDEPEAIRKWVHGIARHKVVDFHRRHRHERVTSDALDAVPADSAPHDAVDLLRWAEREMPDKQGPTLDWLIREGEGEKLEEIANEAELPAPQVRKRVSRLRQHYRAVWAAQIAAAIGILAVLVVAFLLLRRRGDDEAKKIKPEIVADPIAKAVELRRSSLTLCEKREWDACLKGLDQAKQLDPAGDSAPEVVKARDSANDALKPPPPPPIEPVPTTVPSDTDGKKSTPPVTKPSSAPTAAKSAPPTTPTAFMPPTTKSVKPGPKGKSKVDTAFE